MNLYPFWQQGQRHTNAKWPAFCQKHCREPIEVHKMTMIDSCNHENTTKLSINSPSITLQKKIIHLQGMMWFQIIPDMTKIFHKL